MISVAALLVAVSTLAASVFQIPGPFPVRGPLDTEIAVLSNGDVSLAARLQTLAAARRSIRIQALIFTGDESGLYISEILKRKKREGKDVRVIVDALSNPGWQTQWMYYDLKQHGVEVEGYESLYLQWINEVSKSDPTRANKRFHDKMWVIDGEEPDGVAIVGGLNIANEYFRVEPSAKKRWRDQDVVMRGRIVGDVAEAFDRQYEYFKEIKRTRPGLFNTDRNWANWRKLVKKTGGPVNIPFHTRSEVTAEVEKASRRKLELNWMPARSRFFQSRPRFGEQFIQQAYLTMTDETPKGEEILVANAYFIPEPGLIEAFKRAVRRGVPVKILTNSLETNDLPQLAYASRYTYRDLLEVNLEEDGGRKGARMEIYEWAGAPFGEGTIHAKFAVFGEASSLVGSYNLDPRSHHLNSETAVAFESAALSQELAVGFLERDLAKSRAISWEDAVRFHQPSRAPEKFNLMLSLGLKANL